MAGRPSDTEVRPTDEVVRLREENLRLRDQLIARDAETGLLRGQIAELEAGAARAMHLLQRIKGLVPGIVWKVLARAAQLVKRG
jgi:tetrahydromethanopterin S-methyltransferase subunit F